MTQQGTLKRGDLIQYGSLALPLAFAGLPLYIHAPDLYATEGGLPLALIGSILLAVRLFDAIQDPFIGYISDKFAHHRFWICLAGFAGLVVGFSAIFTLPSSNVALWFTASVVLATTSFSVILINLNAIGSLWTDDTDSKTRITSWREGFGLIGLLTASIIPAILVELYDKQQAYTYFSYISIALFIVSGTLFFRWLKYRHPLITAPIEVTKQSQNDSKLDMRSKIGFLSAFFASKDKNMFFGIYGVSMLASSIPAVLVLFFIRDRLDAESYTGLFLALYFLSGVIAMPLWQILSKRKTKLISWFFAMVLAVATFLWAFFLSEGDIWAYAAVCFFSGIALGAELSLPPSILSDMLEKEKERTTSHFAFLAFLNKAAFALGTGLAFLFLDFVAFEPEIQNTEQALWGLNVIYALIPSVLKVCASILLFKWMHNLSKGEENAFHKRSDAHGFYRSTDRM